MKFKSLLIILSTVALAMFLIVSCSKDNSADDHKTTTPVAQTTTIGATTPVLTTSPTTTTTTTTPVTTTAIVTTTAPVIDGTTTVSPSIVEAEAIIAKMKDAGCPEDKLIKNVAREFNYMEMGKLVEFFYDTASEFTFTLSRYLTFTSPEKVDPFYILYNCNFEDVTDEEQLAYWTAIGNPDAMGVVGLNKMTTAQMSAFLDKYLGVEFTDELKNRLVAGNRAVYIEEYDAYYVAVSDFEGIMIDSYYGWVADDGRYLLAIREQGQTDYTLAVVLMPTDDGFKFLQCIDLNAPVAPKFDVTVNVADPSLLESDNVTRYTDTKSTDTNWHVIFTAQKTVTDFKFFINDSSEYDYKVGEVLFTLDKLTPEKPLIVSTYINDSSCNRGISFVDESGKTHYLGIEFDSTGQTENELYFKEFVN